MNYKTVTLDFWDTLVFYPMTDEIFMERVSTHRISSGGMILAMKLRSCL